MNKHKLMVLLVAFMQLLPQMSYSQDDGDVFVDPNQQEIDSLLIVAKNDTSSVNKAILYLEVSYLTCNYDTCLKYAFLSLEYNKGRLPKGMAQNYTNIAVAYYMKDESRKALEYRFKAADLYNQLSNKRAEAITFMHIGNCYLDLNYKDSVFYYYNKAIVYFTEAQDTSLLASLYNCLGQIYCNLSLYDNAIENLQKALNYSLALKDTLGMAKCYFCIGRTTIFQSDTLIYSAIKNLNKAVSLYESKSATIENDVEDKHNAYLALASAYIEAAKLTGNKDYADSCYMFIKKVGNYYQSVGSNCNYILSRYCYVDYYVFCKRYGDALAELLGIEKYLADDRSTSSYESYYNYLYEVYSNLGDYKNALECHKKYMKYKMAFVNDSTLNIIKDAEVERAHMIDSINHSYETLRIESEHKLEMQRKQSEVYILLAVFIAILLVGVFAFRWYRTNKQKNELMLRHKALEIERTLLRSQMNPHFIFNAMNSIQHFISTNETHEAERYLSKFAKLIRLVLDSSTKQAVALTEELQFLSLYLDLEQVRFAGKFTYKIDIDDNVEEDLIGVPPMLMQPFIENSIIHGLMHKENGEGLITIKVEEHDKDTLQCSIIDNGIGRKAAAEFNKLRDKSHKSIGMKLTRERLKDLNKPENVEKSYVVTDLEDENGNALGTKTTILMPIYDI